MHVQLANEIQSKPGYNSAWLGKNVCYNIVINLNVNDFFLENLPQPSWFNTNLTLPSITADLFVSFQCQCNGILVEIDGKWCFTVSQQSICPIAIVLISYAFVSCQNGVEKAKRKRQTNKNAFFHDQQKDWLSNKRHRKGSVQKNRVLTSAVKAA